MCICFYKIIVNFCYEKKTWNFVVPFNSDKIIKYLDKKKGFIISSRHEILWSFEVSTDTCQDHYKRNSWLLRST